MVYRLGVPIVICITKNEHADQHKGVALLIANKMAEREGFEPSIRDKPYTPLAGERLQPLGHLSEKSIRCI